VTAVVAVNVLFSGITITIIKIKLKLKLEKIIITTTIKDIKV